MLNWIIDLSHDANKIEYVVKEIKPLVEKFGFFNQDVAFLSGVYIKQKSQLYQSFISEIRNRIFRLEGQSCRRYSSQYRKFR